MTHGPDTRGRVAALLAAMLALGCSPGARRSGSADGELGPRRSLRGPAAGAPPAPAPRRSAHSATGGDQRPRDGRSAPSAAAAADSPTAS